MNSMALQRCVLAISDEEDETEDKPVVVGVTQRKMRASRLLRPCSMEGSDAEAAASKRFHDAVRAGDVTTVSTLLATGLVDPDDPNRDGGGSTAILEAARHNQPEVAAALLDAGCDPSLGDNSGWTAMHEVFKSPDVARLLLQSLTARWDVADSAGGLTPLHVIVKSAVSTNVTPTASQLEVLKEVARMSNVGAVTCTKDTALHLASSGRHDRPEVVRVVLDAVPTMTLCNAQNNRGETPLHLAVVNGNYETALALLEHVEVLRRGRSGGLRRAKGKLVLSAVPEGDIVENDIRGKSSIKKPKHKNLNEVERAGCKSPDEELRNRQDKGNECEITSQHASSLDGDQVKEQDDDRDQETLEHEASQDTLQQADESQGKQPEVTQNQNDAIQRQNGAEIPPDKSTDEKHGNRHQDYSNHQKTGDSNDSEITITVQDVDDATLGVSSHDQDEKTTHNGTHCDDQNADQNGNAPNGAGTAVDRIEVDLCDRFGQTVLHYCAARNATSVLEPLLRHSGVCDVQDLQGDTALHVAARRGHDRSLALLLQFGADPSIRNNDGRTALDLAVAAGFADATKVLYENATEPVLRNADALRRQDSVRRCTRIGRIFLEVEVPSQSSATKQL
ncbi:poly [ADP-ribose] polymerase tankyrase-1-like [Ixodes scapularis]